jgi:hypothetical protein
MSNGEFTDYSWENILFSKIKNVYNKKNTGSIWNFLHTGLLLSDFLQIFFVLRSKVKAQTKYNIL